MATITILKTYKLFIGGAFPRTESGRFYKLQNNKNDVIANVCLSSRKDFRNAVSAARKVADAWNERPAFNKGQIIYRIAEILEGRKLQFIEELMLQGISKINANKEVQMAIDRCVYYAGWCDKYQTIAGTINPVASSHFNFSIPEPMGVVSILAPEEQSLLALVSLILPVIAGGNTCVVLASEKLPLCAITFAEVLATSDVPAGVVNILTGSSKELHTYFSNHMDVNAIVYAKGNKEEWKTIQQNASLNVKRSFAYNLDWTKEESADLYILLNTQEIKTTWHPIENIGISGAKY